MESMPHIGGRPKLPAQQRPGAQSQVRLLCTGDKGIRASFSRRAILLIVERNAMIPKSLKSTPSRPWSTLALRHQIRGRSDDSRIAGSRRPAVHAATRIAHGFSPHCFGEKTPVAKRAEKSRAAFCFGEDGHDLVRVLQRDVDNIRRQHAAILKTHPANIRPVERLVPRRLQVCQDANADLLIIELD